MDSVDRDLLLGYLMNALEEDEISLVERELMRQPELRRELAELQKELSPLTFVYESVDPPKHLARRTCDKIWATVDREEKIGRCLVGSESPIQQIVSISITSKQVSSLPTLPVLSPSLSPVLSSKPSRLVSREKADASEESQTISVDETVRVENEPQSSDRRLTRRKPGLTSPSRSSRRAVAAPSEDATSQKKRERGRRLFDIALSVAIGILIAVMAFPAINFAKSRTRQLITQNKIKELNQSVGLYAPVSENGVSPASSEESGGINLAYSAWQEVKPMQAPILTVGNNSRLAVSSVPPPYASNTFVLPPSSRIYFSPVSNDAPVFNAPYGRDIVLGQAPNRQERVEIDPGNLSYQTLLSYINSTAPAGNGATLQTAFGQNVLFQNNRIFVRVLPVFQAVTQESLDSDARVGE